MLVTFNVVKDKNEPVTSRQIGDGAFKGQPVDGAAQGQVGSAPKLRPGLSSGTGSIASSSEIRLRPLLAQLHQHHVDRQPMQPGGEGGVAAESCNLAV